MPAQDEHSAPTLYGMDAEHAKKVQEKFDPEYENKAKEWITTLTGSPVTDFYSSLKSGIVLLKLLERIKPGCVTQKPNTKSGAFFERENILQYLRICAEIGVPSHELFTIADLQDKKSLPAVLTNIYALGRIVQTLPSYNGPRLGVKWSITEEEAARRKEAKERERIQEEKAIADINSRQKSRREYLEREKTERTLKLENDEMEKAIADINSRQKSRREYLEREKTERTLKLENDEMEKMKKRRLSRGRSEMIDPSKIRKRSISPVRYGMDLEIENKLIEKVSTEDDFVVMDWVEQVTNEEVDDIYHSLKSGVTLCKLANAIQPSVVGKIHTKEVPLLERENIQNYIVACQGFGVVSSDLFSVSDLYDRKMLSSVSNNLRALGRVAKQIPTFHGPYLGQAIAKSDAELEAGLPPKKIVGRSRSSFKELLRRYAPKLLFGTFIFVSGFLVGYSYARGHVTQILR